MIQILSGLSTYLLLAIYSHEEHSERVSIKRVRELRNKIRNETRAPGRKISATLKNPTAPLEIYLQILNRTLLIWT
ncbi:MAG: hypothetical protein A2521_08900 [Deltaproteobacteria bacterium RIFOXYD12_FULL_57_12]|nr:MAG: hypothetical protein A2521_08900 [Deltaproteobacteria bacterium RIFOXYD12_FULL_57_12]